MDEKQFEHWCEACGTTVVLTPAEALEADSDFSPRMGAWGVVSERTCGDCGIEQTRWWALTVEKKDLDSCTPHQRHVLSQFPQKRPRPAQQIDTTQVATH